MEALEQDNCDNCQQEVPSSGTSRGVSVAVKSCPLLFGLRKKWRLWCVVMAPGITQSQEHWLPGWSCLVTVSQWTEENIYFNLHFQLAH